MRGKKGRRLKLQNRFSEYSHGRAPLVANSAPPIRTEEHHPIAGISTTFHTNKLKSRMMTSSHLWGMPWHSEWLFFSGGQSYGKKD